jgi:hypothetical protein
VSAQLDMPLFFDIVVLQSLGRKFSSKLAPFRSLQLRTGVHRDGWGTSSVMISVIFMMILMVY